MTEPVIDPVVDPNSPPPVDPKAQTPDGDKPPEGTLTPPDTKEPPDPSTPDIAAVRAALAGGDDKFLKQLERYRTLDDMQAGWKEATKAAQKKAEPLALPDDPKPEDFDSFRTALGLPEKAEEYPVDFREGYEVTDADKEVLGSLRETLHEKAGDPRTAGVVMEWYQDTVAQQQQDLDQAAADKSDETQETLRAEYGTDYKGNIEAANSLIRQHMGEEGHAEILEARFEDGTRLQDHLGFLKMTVNLGTEYYGGTGIISGDVETTAKTIDQKLEDFRKMQTEDKEKYYTDEVQQQVAALYAQKDKLAKRK